MGREEKLKLKIKTSNFLTPVHVLGGRPAVHVYLYRLSIVRIVAAGQNDSYDVTPQRLWSTGHGDDGQVAGVVAAVKGEAVPHRAGLKTGQRSMDFRPQAYPGFVRACVCVRMCVCICVCKCVCSVVYVCMCLHVYMCVCMCV